MFRRGLLTVALLVGLLAPSFPPLLAPPARAAAGGIYTSQLGFVADDAKAAVLALPAGTAMEPAFRILEAASGAVVFSSQTGDVQAYPNGWQGSNSRGDTYRMDFTRWTSPNTSARYVVESNGLRSLPFEVGPAAYDVRRVKPLEFFRLQQSGVSVSWQSLDGTSGGHGPDHQDDARQANRSDAGGGDRRLIEQDYLALPEGRLDTRGGWFDAGDYNKYMGNTPWAAYLLLLTYEEFPSYWSGVDDNGNGQADLLEYVRHALEWMLTMQHSDGSVYERVFNGYSALFDGKPDGETDNQPGTRDDRPLDTDRYADITAKSAYAMAAAYRVFGDQRYLDSAVKAWDWAYSHQGVVKPKRYGGGLYFGDVEIGLTLGALELHRALSKPGVTPPAKYMQYATDRVRAHLAVQDWVNPSSWDYQQSYALIRYFDFGSELDQTTILNQLKGRWDAGILSQSRNAYRMNDEWLYSDFGQNDLSASGAGDALWVFGKTGDRKYRDYAVNQMAWIFGRNPFGESWLASRSSAQEGEYTRLPHWRATAKHPIEGVVVPGATDRDGNGIPDYTDTAEWFYSEPTINQQAMFVRVMTALHHAVGGSSGPPPATDTPPVAAIVSPANGALVSGTANVEATASDDGGVASASYRVDSGPLVAMSIVTGTTTAGTWRASWDTTTSPDGQHTVAVVVTDTVGQKVTSSATVNVNNGAAPRLHVERIDVALAGKGGSPKVQAKTDVYVYDAFGKPVAGASVSGHWQGAATDTFTGSTDTTGKVTDYSNAANSASGITFTAVVDGVAKSGWLYDQAANKETSDAVSVP